MLSCGLERRTQGTTRTKEDLQNDADWMKFTQPDPRDTLEDIGAPVTVKEIEDAYEHMRGGKATQSDGISREIMDLIPPSYKDIFVEYISHVFRTGETDTEEGRADIVLLTKKLDKSKQEITNKRPIALVKFVTKWIHAILMHRIQQRIQHLAN